MSRTTVRHSHHPWLVARPAKLTASRIRTEEMLLGALLRRAERGRWPLAAGDS
jgi:hypothetical protein